jgi:hypothetical protein
MSSDEPIDPRTLKPGDRIRYKRPGPARGDERVLERRKDDDSGWWLTDRSGLADRVWADGDWEVLP